MNKGLYKSLIITEMEIQLNTKFFINNIWFHTIFLCRITHSTIMTYLQWTILISVHERGYLYDCTVRIRMVRGLCPRFPTRYCQFCLKWIKSRFASFITTVYSVTRHGEMWLYSVLQRSIKSYGSIINSYFNVTIRKNFYWTD